MRSRDLRTTVMSGARHRLRRLTAALFIGLVSTATAQAAPLIDGLGGPLDLGQPVTLESIRVTDVSVLFPEGIRFYDGEPYTEISTNRPGSVSFGGSVCCLGERWTLPSPGAGPNNSLLAPPRIVAFLGFGQQTLQDADGRTPFTYEALIPPEGDDPGRYISTWYRVVDQDTPGVVDPRVNTWQSVITPVGRDGDFDLELRYVTCQWAHPWDNPNARLPVVGFDAGLGEDGPGWMWPGSTTLDTLLLCGLSNVREPGVFRYQFRDGWPSGCGYDAEPPPGADRCADGNHLPGDGCSPACYVEPDVDGDGVYEAPHPDSVDPRGVYDDCTDLMNAACDADRDDDGIPDEADNCDDDFNPDQRNYDGDPHGDVCDEDQDGDLLLDNLDPDDPRSAFDTCPFRRSAGTRVFGDVNDVSDIDGDGLADQCDDDDDDDGVLDCGGDGLCDPLDNGYDDDRDNATDEADECQPGSQRYERCHGGNDSVDNDADGFVDEFSEAAYDWVEWPGPDAPPSAPEDNCRRIPNPDQGDIDGDGLGDACDPDKDGDTINNCQGNGICGPDMDGRDNDRDGFVDETNECLGGCGPVDGDLIDQDFDGFVDEAGEEAIGELPDRLDNCPEVANRDQADWNQNGRGDACDDSDGDGVPDAVDNCRDEPNMGQLDPDEDGFGNACDDDDDGDGVPDVLDNCPLVANADQANLGADRVGDACDPDDDGDGVIDTVDVCPRTRDPDQADLDGDGRGDACDPDDDGDGVADAADVCPTIADDQSDLDGDGLGDACDDDVDGDGVPDAVDGCPRTPDARTPDLDGDGISDACDAADDRPFELRGPEERCALLIARGASTAERLRHCPPGAGGGCAVAPAADHRPGALLLLLPLLLGARRRLRRIPAPKGSAAKQVDRPRAPMRVRRASAPTGRDEGVPGRTSRRVARFGATTVGRVPLPLGAAAGRPGSPAPPGDG